MACAVCSAVRRVGSVNSAAGACGIFCVRPRDGLRARHRHHLAHGQQLAGARELGRRRSSACALSCWIGEHCRAGPSSAWKRRRPASMMASACATAASGWLARFATPRGRPRVRYTSSRHLFTSGSMSADGTAGSIMNIRAVPTRLRRARSTARADDWQPGGCS